MYSVGVVDTTFARVDMAKTAIDVIRNGIENDYLNKESAEKLIERLQELKSKIEERIEV